jgi:putative Mg2+ transporter-C (MgtC) family protein
MGRWERMIESDYPLIALRLGVATLAGLGLGLEREWRGRDAGLRTHALVALSSAMITISALSLSQEMRDHGGDSDPLRVVQGLAQAIGFIAGGLIFVRGGDVQNMTTAASLWMAAAVGIAAGAGQFALVMIASAIALILLGAAHFAVWLRPPACSDTRDAEQLQTPSRRGTVDRRKP